MTALLGAVIVLAAGFVKGSVGFGFPAFATPLLALVVDVKVAVAILILPNIVMDGIQVARRGNVVTTIRRMAVLLAAGMVGTILGTRLLVVLPSRAVTLILGVFVVTFVVLNLCRFSPRVPARWEKPLSAPVGLLAGMLGGVTNVPATPLVIYFYALRLEKYEFVRSASLSFLIYKVIQLGAVTYYGLLSWRLFGISVLAAAVALGSFSVGLRIQDRLDQRAFNRTVLVLLGVLGIWLVVRGLRA